MPKYQYACPDCGDEFEATQKFADKPLKKCPTCGKRNIYRAIRQVAVSFKGSGFYVNDSKSSDNKKAVKPKSDEKTDEKANADSTTEVSKEGTTPETTPTTTDAPKVEGKTETKTETKAETKDVKKEKKAKPAD
jgi:putative FmdB family regulatory protein